MSNRLPLYFIPHGAGPWPFMDLSSGVFGSPENWQKLATHLKEIGENLTPAPKAILVVTAHWEAAVPTVSSHPSPGMLYDYGGFPAQTYQLNYPAPGSPELAQRVQTLLTEAEIANAEDKQRGFDHGTFIPLMLMYPQATIPVVQLSLQQQQDPALHIAIGEALQPLRDEGVLIIGSGMSVHNMYAFRSPDPRHKQNAELFDEWLQETLALPEDERKARLKLWQKAPGGVASHQPTPEHLTPLFVVAGAAGSDPAERTFAEDLIELKVSEYRFG